MPWIPGWLDPLEHQAAATQQVYDYLVHDAMIKPMLQEAGVQMAFEAWEEYWRRTPAAKTIVVQGHQRIPPHAWLACRPANSTWHSA